MVGLALATICAAAVLGCTKKDGEAKASFAEISVADATAMQKSGNATFFDANTDDFRESNGKVPGAVLLPSSHDYELSLLGQDKDRQLVFYCTSKT